MDDLLSIYLAVILAGLEATSETEAVLDLLTAFKDPALQAHLLNIDVKSIACCRKISDRTAKKRKQSCCVHCFSDSYK